VPLEITSREQEGIQIVDLKGRLTFGQEDLDFRNALEGMVRAGENRVVLNLLHVSDLDTTGLGTLLFATAELKKAGGNLVLVNLNHSHIELLIDARLHTAFEIFQNDEDAVNSFFPGREVKHYDILEFVHSRQQKPV
jgi:anti-sigma B factor antagonist